MGSMLLFWYLLGMFLGFLTASQDKVKQNSLRWIERQYQPQARAGGLAE